MPRSIGSGVFRSEEMVLCQLFLQSNVAFETTCHLGILEFRDLNPKMNAYQRKYVDEVRHIGEVQRKLVYLNQQLINENIEIVKPDVEPLIPRYREIIEMENRIDVIDTKLRHINNYLDSLRLKELELIERSKILDKTTELLETTRRQRSYSVNGLDDYRLERMAQGQLKNRNIPEGNKIYTATGLIRSEKALAFRKIIWRVCGQNALVQFYDVETPINDVRVNEYIQKKVFLIMCPGQQLFIKIKKICDAFHAVQYPLPEGDLQYKQMRAQVENELRDVKLIIEETHSQKHKTLSAVAAAENFQTWVIQFTKLRGIFATMNLYQKTEKGFLVEGWCSNNDYSLLTGIIDQINKKVGVQGQACVEKVPTNSTPPTYFRSNKFIKGFQNIVDSYGVATYREINPAPYTIITFPFLFAIMFADAGHGTVMLLFALWMILCERRLKNASKNEIWLTFFDGRYIIGLMGAFSIYTGSIYNDVFAKGINVFGTSFKLPNHLNHTNVDLSIDSLHKGTKPYPFGVDPAWQLSENKILFLNSFKMKLSVILGVSQMFFGVILSLFNHIHRKNIVSILFEFIPQTIFLLSLFGYLIVLVFAKWLIVWDDKPAPSILIDFINMFLMKYPDKPAYLAPWFDHKQLIQTILLILALMQVPIMLLVKPVIKVVFHSKNHDSIGNEDHSESTGDVFIHQAIHTIEYCLGSISHTASYLRLWALSLAHSQLSEVLWSMVMRAGFASSSSNDLVRIATTYLAFGFWAILTVAILIVMEGLSAFLHALRLHWVEFQSKFYQGSGFTFRPFDLKTILTETNILAE
ncbi:hypothetical protein QR98_0086750 [Sarcoptes scabiei]|uniref:V-type proton ATPase subunit a n=1 Tax=Sarcoptes scabiei TaxID=52283 RepID=A0A132AHT5_SARSC|nr:hypothetical protein QR98_0086750 [Sarcoptes scabiei]